MAGNDLAEVLADGRVGYWHLGEPMGSVTAADASGNGNDRTSSGGVTFGQPGLYGADTAALFDGATGRISGPNSATISPAKITMEAKVRWDGPTGFPQRIPEKESYAGIRQYGLSVLSDGHVHVGLRMRVSGAPQVIPADSVGRVVLGAGYARRRNPKAGSRFTSNSMEAATPPDVPRLAGTEEEFLKGFLVLTGESECAPE